MRYQKIFVQIWNDEKFIALSEASKVFFLYLLTSPHSNLIGAFVLKKGYVAEDLIWSTQKVDKAIKELEKSKLLIFDKAVSVAVINNYLKYNPLQNPNQYLGAMDIFKTLPKTSILLNIYNTLETLSKRFNKPFETASKPEAVTDTDTVTEPDTEEVVKEKYIPDFNSVWERYPNKDSRKKSQLYFYTTVKTEEDFNNINKALDNYIAHLKIETWKKPKSGSTWFNNWQDWTEWEEPVSQVKDCSVEIDGEIQFLTETQLKQWKAENGR